ncbi:MAG: Gfo/Idh/MocA family protein [Pirellulaceae bacterium]
MRIRVGLVGLGDAWETRHRAALRSLVDRFEVRAVYSEVAKRAEQVAREFEAEPMDGFRALTERSDIDAVLMLATSWYGPLPVLAACDAGKAIYCASILDIDLDQAQEVKNRVEVSGIAFMAEFPRRHAPSTLRLKELIATRLGPPRLLFCHLRQPGRAGHGTHLDGEQCPQITRELLELVDWCQYVVGSEPTAVFSASHCRPGSGEPSDYRMLSLDFSPKAAPVTGATAQISCGRYIPATWHEAITFRPPAALQVACENGIAFIDLPSTLIWFDEAGRHMESLENERPVGEQLLTQFYRAVTSLVRKTNDLEDAYRALQVITGAQKSCQEGRRIELDASP